MYLLALKKQKSGIALLSAGCQNGREFFFNAGKTLYFVPNVTRHDITEMEESCRHEFHM